MARPTDPDPKPKRSSTRNLPLALIIAGGVAAGLGLARPATADRSTPNVDTSGASAPEATYQRGGRTAGDRAGDAAAIAPSEPQTAAATITIEDFAYRGAVTAAPGSTIAVTNRDGVAHTLSFRSGQPDSGTVESGASSTLTAPNAPGTYAYFCRIHPSMEGEIEITG